jgi:hypothetical protein
MGGALQPPQGCNMKDQNVASPAKDDQAEKPLARKRGKFRFGSILPPLAFFLSLVSFYLSQSAKSSVARLETLKTEYGLFNDMSHMILEHPMMSHLFTATPLDYIEQARAVKKATASLKPEERATLMLQERAAAHYTFTLYEETYFLWKQAQDGEPQKRKLMEDDLGYFNDLFCTNARLAWYWDVKDGGGLSQGFADELNDYYDKNVVAKCSPEKDPEGPFFGGK